MINQMITGIVLGLGLFYVLMPFKAYILPYRKYVDIILACALVYMITVVSTNYVVGLTTYASFTVSLSLRLWAWLDTQSTPSLSLPKVDIKAKIKDFTKEWI